MTRADISEHIGEIRQAYKVIGDAGLDERHHSIIELECIHCGKHKFTTVSTFNNTHRVIGMCDCQKTGKFIGQVINDYKVLGLVTDEALKKPKKALMELECTFCGKKAYVERWRLKTADFKYCKCHTPTEEKKPAKIKYFRGVEDSIHDIRSNKLVSRHIEEPGISYVGKAINAGDTTNKVWCKCNVCNNYAIVDKDELDNGDVYCSCADSQDLLVTAMDERLATYTQVQPYINHMTEGMQFGTDVVIEDKGQMTLVRCLCCNKERYVNSMELQDVSRTWSFKKCDCQLTEEDRKAQETNYIGCIFGDLKIIDYNKDTNKFKARCLKCGDICDCTKFSILSDRKRTCGKQSCITKRVKYRDISYLGKTYNQLKVIDYYTPEDNYNKIFWLCECLRCGSHVLESADIVAAGRVVTCGCDLFKYVLEYNIGDYVDNLEITDIFYHQNIPYWAVVCPYCGDVYVRKAYALSTGNTKSCGCVSTSIGERKIVLFLDKLLSKNKNYTYKREVCFNGLKGRRGSLRFDFAIYRGNDVLCLIEFDGEQHDSVNKQLFKIKSKEKAKYDERAKASFERIQEYDGLKNGYCRDNNIPLLRIKYTVKTAEIEGQILNFLASID